MKLHYLEIVTDDVDGQCSTFSKLHKITFDMATAELGNARTAALPDGSRIGIRAPMSDTETPVTRPYFLTDDIEAAVATLSSSGAEIAHPPMTIPGHGTFAIYILGGNQNGLWQL